MKAEITTLLQECDALKSRLQSLRPLPAQALKKIESALAIEYTYESNRIEGNGRTSRLLMNLYLLRHGYTLVNLKGSNEAKAAYYKALEASHTEQHPEEFLQLVAKAEADSLRRYLAIIGGGETKGTNK